MKINPQCVVALTWTLKDTLGEVLDELDDPVEFLLGGADLLAKIEAALQGHEPGAALDLHLEPEDAFGDFDEMRLFLEPRALFPAEIEEGMTFDGAALPAGGFVGSADRWNHRHSTGRLGGAATADAIARRRNDAASGAANAGGAAAFGR